MKLKNVVTTKQEKLLSEKVTFCFVLPMLACVSVVSFMRAREAREGMGHKKGQKKNLGSGEGRGREETPTADRRHFAEARFSANPISRPKLSGVSCALRMETSDMRAMPK